jgi:hypothetical protein
MGSISGFGKSQDAHKLVDACKPSEPTFAHLLDPRLNLPLPFVFLFNLRARVWR